MSFSLLRRWLPMLLVVLMALPVRADDDPPPSPKPDAAEGDDAPGEDTPEDRYRLPETSKDLRDFIVKMLSFQPTSRKEAIEHQEKAIPAVRSAAKQILKLEKDESSDFAKTAQAVLLQLDIQGLRAGEKIDPKALTDRAVAFVKLIGGPKASGFEVELVAMLGQTLEGIGKDELAVQVYLQASDVLVNSDDERVARAAKVIAGMGRRLDLPGNPIDIKGVTAGGDPFDLKSLKGKVVLIDFWATWCGPCLAEIPNMERNYKRFKTKGFEIVGINVDEDRDALDGFLEKRELPWIVLHDDSEQGHPAAIQYGAMSLPTMFLVGSDGKVLSTNARGQILTRLLEEQFPDTPEVEEDSEAKVEEEKDEK